MEKNQLLDACRKAIGLCVFIVLLASCSMPRILVLRDPLSPEEHINPGLSYEKNGEHDAALKEYKTAPKKPPIGYLYIGNILFQNHNYEGAEKAYKHTIYKTDDPRAHNNLAWLYYISGMKLAEAETHARRAVELSPDNQDFTDTLLKIMEEDSITKVCKTFQADFLRSLALVP